MTLKTLDIGGTTILVEVTELTEAQKGGFEYTATGEKLDLSERIRDLLGALAKPVRNVIEGTGAEEWELEVNIGFSGETGLPFVAKAETNASVKVRAKWKKA